jgi:hypothetical protein
MKTNFKENIDKLIQGTIQGKIIWIKPSENAFVWRTENSEGQKINNKVTNIMFRLYEIESKISLIDLDTKDLEDVETYEAIFKLYNTIKENFDVGRNDILSDLLKDI